MEPIIAFYSHQGPDAKGRTLKQIWNFSDRELEETHDYIQWLFPTTEMSMFNHDAPVLTSETICTFLESEEMISNLITSSFIFQRFLKLEDELPFWVKRPGGRDNHNCLRISRVITSLNLLEQYKRAESFYKQVLKVYLRNNSSSVFHWEYAHQTFSDIESPLANSISEILKPVSKLIV